MRRRRATVGREDRTTEYARRNAARRSEAREPLPELFPDLVRGARLVFPEEDLARDLRQEAELARLEGRDPEEAVRAYRSRELAWRVFAALPLDRDVAA